MSDLIKRADAIEAVQNARAITGAYRINLAVEALKALPSADAVSREDWLNLIEEYNNTIGAIMAVISAPTGIKEISDHFAELIKEEQTDSVVRCKDCKMIDENGWCDFIKGYVHDGYCAWGELAEQTEKGGDAEMKRSSYSGEPLMQQSRPHGRLIDADALMGEFADRVKESNNSDFIEPPDWNDAVYLVGSAPTVEVGIPHYITLTEDSTIEPVRPHGEWLDWLGSGNEWECSVCKCSIESHGSIAYNFCPMCGADMRGDNNE